MPKRFKVTWYEKEFHKAFVEAADEEAAIDEVNRLISDGTLPPSKTGSGSNFYDEFRAIEDKGNSKTGQ